MESFLLDHLFLKNKHIKRKIFLDKLPEVILERKSSRKRRLQCFISGMDILKKTKYIFPNPSNKSELCFLGEDKNGYLVEIHVREEVHQKDRRLFFVSCFYKDQKKKSPPTS